MQKTTSTFLAVIFSCFVNLHAMVCEDMAVDSLTKQFSSQCAVKSDPLPSIEKLYPPTCSQWEKDKGLQQAAALGSESAVQYLLCIGANALADNCKAIECAAKNGHVLLAHNLRSLADLFLVNRSTDQPME